MSAVIHCTASFLCYAWLAFVLVDSFLEHLFLGLELLPQLTDTIMA
jgi:hypothetical protein